MKGGVRPSQRLIAYPSLSLVLTLPHNSCLSPVRCLTFNMKNSRPFVKARIRRHTEYHTHPLHQSPMADAEPKIDFQASGRVTKKEF